MKKLSRMSFPTSSQDSDRSFNNADSFAFAFDEAWKNLPSEHKDETLSRDEKIKLTLSKLKGHPFLKGSPSMAEEVALFRVRLLGHQ